MNDELERMAQAAADHHRLETAKLAAMTPAEQEAYIRAWALRMAEHEVAAGVAYDRWANGHSPSGD